MSYGAKVATKIVYCEQKNIPINTIIRIPEGVEGKVLKEEKKKRWHFQGSFVTKESWNIGWKR